MALWGVDKLRVKRMQAPVSPVEGRDAIAPSRETIAERLLLFQTGKALESPLRFMKWAERTGAAHDERDLALERVEAEKALVKIKSLLMKDPHGAILTQGERVPDRAMDLTRPMKSPE